MIQSHKTYFDANMVQRALGSLWLDPEHDDARWLKRADNCYACDKRKDSKIQSLCYPCQHRWEQVRRCASCTTYFTPDNPSVLKDIVLCVTCVQHANYRADGQVRRCGQCKYLVSIQDLRTGLCPQCSPPPRATSLSDDSDYDALTEDELLDSMAGSE